MRFLLSSILFMYFSVANAATLIDFNSETIGPVDPLVTDGFRFEALSSIWTSEIIAQSPDDNALYLGAGGVFDQFGSAGPIFIRLTTEDSSAFSLLSAELETANSAFGAEADPFITGFTTDGVYVSGPLGSADWESLQYVDFGVSSCCGAPGLQPEFLEVTLDNVVVGAAVPIPAAVWLFGSALAGLSWLRRKQTV